MAMEIGDVKENKKNGSGVPGSPFRVIAPH
jgi:hypothetical protein